MGAAVDFKQYNYPGVSYCGGSFASQGCGPTSVADLLAAINDSITPPAVASWMTAKGYATTDGHGTYWEGINAALAAFGGDGRMIGSSMDGQMSSPVFDLWKKHIQSGYMGVLLMHNVISNYWTNSGHYIAVVDYDAKTDRYMVFDPASVARTKWHPFSDFAGNICCLYTSTIRWDHGKTYIFTPKQVEAGFQGAEASILELILYSRGFYARKSGMLDNSCGPKLSKAITNYQKKRKEQGASDMRVDGKCGPQTWGDLFGTNQDHITLVPVGGGSQGLTVLFVQELLSGYGYYLGALDRSFGNQTITATNLLRKKLGLPQNGTWDADLFKRICTNPVI